MRLRCGDASAACSACSYASTGSRGTLPQRDASCEDLPRPRRQPPRRLDGRDSDAIVEPRWATLSVDTGRGHTGGGRDSVPVGRTRERTGQLRLCLVARRAGYFSPRAPSQWRCARCARGQRGCPRRWRRHLRVRRLRRGAVRSAWRGCAGRGDGRRCHRVRPARWRRARGDGGATWRMGRCRPSIR